MFVYSMLAMKLDWLLDGLINWLIGIQQHNNTTGRETCSGGKDSQRETMHNTLYVT